MIQIVNELKGKSQNSMTLVKAYDFHIARIKELIGIDFAPNTVKRYQSSLNGLKEFIAKYYKKADIRLSDLEKVFIESYERFLKTDKGLKQNSAAKDIKNLCRLINKAISYKWINTDPFSDFSCPYIDPPRSYLTNDEINRKKTGTRSSIPILPRAQEILNRYKTDPFCISSNKMLPIYTNQRMNSYLKEIADICGITKPLTTHIGHHTFATTITLSNGVPIETVSKMLGHSDLKTTALYAKIVDSKIADDMKCLFDKKIEPSPAVNQN